MKLNSIYMILFLMLTVASPASEWLDSEDERGPKKLTAFQGSSYSFSIEESFCRLIHSFQSEAYRSFIHAHPLHGINYKWYLAELVELAVEEAGDPMAIFTLLTNFRVGIRRQNVKDLHDGREQHFFISKETLSMDQAQPEITDFLRRHLTEQNCKSFMKAAFALMSLKERVDNGYWQKQVGEHYVDIASKVVMDFLYDNAKYREVLGRDLLSGRAVTHYVFYPIEKFYDNDIFSDTEAAFMAYASFDAPSQATTYGCEALLGRLRYIHIQLYRENMYCGSPSSTILFRAEKQVWKRWRELHHWKQHRQGELGLEITCPFAYVWESAQYMWYFCCRSYKTRPYIHDHGVDPGCCYSNDKVE